MTIKAVLVTLGLLVLTACGSSAGSTTTVTTGPPAPTTTPSSSATTVPDTAVPESSASTSTSSRSAPTMPSLPTITVTAGEVSGPGTLEFKLGQEAAFEVVADVADEVHVHGYDLHFDSGPGVPVEVRFTADVPGEFEVELEDAGLELVKLVVEP